MGHQTALQCVLGLSCVRSNFCGQGEEDAHEILQCTMHRRALRSKVPYVFASDHAIRVCGEHYLT